VAEANVPEGTGERTPFGVPELLAAVAGASRVVDAGCGSGRLTVALARAGARVTGFDTSVARLEDARRRAEAVGVELTLVEADLDAPLPFPDGAFDAVTSRLALMVADDPVATLRELARVLEPGGRLATVLWASLDRNPWFDAPRQAVAAVLGEERASFARAFGKLGEPEEAEAVHRAAGLEDVRARLLHEQVCRADATEHWHLLCRENGHFRRVDAALGDDEREAVIGELATRLAGHREDGVLLLPRALFLVTARRGD
jgi:SAM-dependent methyltransferase